MKKIALIGVTALTALSLAACSSNSSSSGNTKESSANSSSNSKESSIQSSSSSKESSAKRDLTEIRDEDYNSTVDTAAENYPAVDYNTLARTPEAYEGKEITISGNVIQATDPGEDEFTIVLVDTDGVEGDGSHIAEIVVESSYFKENRILEEDDIVVHGISYGVDTYESTSNGTMTVPVAVARFYEVTPGQ
ncbi:hypothetical protein [Lactovum odontotermitis]